MPNRPTSSISSPNWTAANAEPIRRTRRLLADDHEPIDRQPGCYLGDPKHVNYSPFGLGATSMLRTWLSMWSLDDSQCRGEAHLGRIAIPSLVVQATADRGVFPSDARASTTHSGRPTSISSTSPASTTSRTGAAIRSPISSPHGPRSDVAEPDHAEPSDALGIAARLFAAIEAGDIEAVGRLYAPDLQVWHNTDGLIQDRDANLRTARMGSRQPRRLALRRGPPGTDPGRVRPAARPARHHTGRRRPRDTRLPRGRGQRRSDHQHRRVSRLRPCGPHPGEGPPGLSRWLLTWRPPGRPSCPVPVRPSTWAPEPGMARRSRSVRPTVAVRSALLV